MVNEETNAIVRHFVGSEADINSRGNRADGTGTAIFSSVLLAVGAALILATNTYEASDLKKQADDLKKLEKDLNKFEDNLRDKGFIDEKGNLTAEGRKLDNDLKKTDLDSEGRTIKEQLEEKRSQVEEKRQALVDADADADGDYEGKKKKKIGSYEKRLAKKRTQAQSLVNQKNQKIVEVKVDGQTRAMVVPANVEESSLKNNVTVDKDGNLKLKEDIKGLSNEQFKDGQKNAPRNVKKAVKNIDKLNTKRARVQANMEFSKIKSGGGFRTRMKNRLNPLKKNWKKGKLKSMNWGAKGAGLVMMVWGGLVANASAQASQSQSLHYLGSRYRHFPGSSTAIFSSTGSHGNSSIVFSKP